MNTLFAERYGFAPTRLRKPDLQDDSTAPDHPKVFSFFLAYRPPFDWRGVLAFLEKRAIPGVEAVDDGEYRRVLRVGDGTERLTSWIRVRHAAKRDALELTLSPVFAKVLPRVLTTVKRVFDLHADPVEISDALGPLAARNRGLRLPGAFDGFELAVRAILGQQVTVKAARTLATRFVAAHGEKIEFEDAPAMGELCAAFPTPDRVATLSQDDIAKLGIVAARANAIIAIARNIADGALDLSGKYSIDDTIAALQTIKGIGPWTAHYIAMRALSWPDAWPPQDVALLNALELPNTRSGQREADALAEQWRPWRSYAVLHLWQRLESKQ